MDWRRGVLSVSVLLAVLRPSQQSRDRRIGPEIAAFCTESIIVVRSCGAGSWSNAGPLNRGGATIFATARDRYGVASCRMRDLDFIKANDGSLAQQTA
jgi:hypothetical protein